jgi:hypothetical protein
MAVSASPDTVSYQAPVLKTLGSVEELTQVRLKKVGSADGFTWNGTPITDAST